MVSRNTDEHISEDHWLKQFENTLQKGAVQPKSQQSLYDQINNIMNGTGSKYPSVQAAVDDMMQRSGLTNYLQASEEAPKTKTASDGSLVEPEPPEPPSEVVDPLVEKMRAAAQSKQWHVLGKLNAELDRHHGDPPINGVESIRVLKYFKDPEIASTQVPLDKWAEYTSGYGDGLGLTPDQKAKDLEFTYKVLEHIRGKIKKATDQNSDFDKTIPVERKQKDTTTPDVIKACPAVLRTLENHVRSTRGNLPIPAIIDKIRSIHQGDVSEDKVWDDDKLIRLVSKLNLEAKKNNPASYENYSNLAVGDRDNAESDIDPSNTDAFNALMPAKL